MGDVLEELSFSEWPDPPGSHPWLPAYGYQPPPQDHALEKEDFLDPVDAALFLGGGIGGVGNGTTFLETILEETSEELCSDGDSPIPPCWLDDSDADSVIHVPHLPGKEDFDSGSERDFLCPAKRRKPNQIRADCPSPTDTTSLSLSLSRSSSLAQFESLEQSCQLLEASAPPSPLSLLSLDSLDKFNAIPETEISPDSLENSSDSDMNSSSSQESTYLNNTAFYKGSSVLESHFNDRSISEEKFNGATFAVSIDAKKFWSADEERNNSSGEFSDARSSDSEHTVHENNSRSKRDVPHKYNFKSCRSLDALTSFECLDTSKIDNAYANAQAVKRIAQKHANQQYSVENLSEDSGYSEHFCNFLKTKSKSIPNVYMPSGEKSNLPSNNKTSLKRKSDDDLTALFKCKRRSEIVGQFGARGKFHTKPSQQEKSTVPMPAPRSGCDIEPANGTDGRSEGIRGRTEIASECVGQVAAPHVRGAARPRSARSLPDVSAPGFGDLDGLLDPRRARNTFPKSVADKLARLIDEQLDDRVGSDLNLYSVSSVPKDLNLCDEEPDGTRPSVDDNWSFGSERAVSVAAKNFDLCDFAYTRKSFKVHEASFKQAFRVCDSFTTSVADLTVLDYRSDSENAPKNVLKKLTEKKIKMSRNTSRERSAESDSTTESEKHFLFEMEKTMRELNEQSRKILTTAFDDGDFDRNLSILTNQRLNAELNPFDDVIAELEKKQARSKKTTAQKPPLEYEFDFYGEEDDPPYYRRNCEATPQDTSSPDVSENFDGADVFYHSTPVKCVDKVQSTPNLNSFNQEDEDMYASSSPREEFRSSMQHVPLKNEFKPVGILGSKSQGLSGSGSSKGVHFCPVVAEVSWRERSYSEDSTGVASSTSSGYSCEAEEPGAGAAPPAEPLAQTSADVVGGGSVSAGVGVDIGNNADNNTGDVDNNGRMETEAARAAAPAPPPKPARSRLGGFLSRFANFRFSARKAGAKKKRDVEAPPRPPCSPPHVAVPLSARPPLPPGARRGLLETDLDRGLTSATQPPPPSPSPCPPPDRALSLLALGPPPAAPRSHKSMETLLPERRARRDLEPPENDLQKNSNDRVLSEHQLRVQRSLQKLDLPDWYKNSPVPREGFLLKKRASDAGAGTRGWETPGLGSKTTSLGSLGGTIPLARSPLALTPPSQQLTFSRWSTSRLNSTQTSPCSSARSSIRGGAISPVTSPARPPRIPRPSRTPYLGWRSQERLASPRTPHERLAVSLLPQSPPVPNNVSDEIQSSIKEVTSAIVHYVSGLEPNQDRLNIEADGLSASPRGSPRLCWLESSFVGTKPLESPQTPVVVGQLTPPHQQSQPRPLQLDLPSSRPTANGNVTLSSTTYQHDWQSPQHSLLNLAINKPSPGSTTLEDVLDSLLGLPAAIPRLPSPQNSPRRAPSPYYIVGLQNRYNEHNNSQTSSLQLSLSSKTDDRSEYQSAIHLTEETCNSLEYSRQDGEVFNRRRSSAESSSCSTLAPGMDGADKEDSNSTISLPKIRARAKSATAGKHSSRRQSEPVAAQKSHSLDRRISCDSRISKELNLSKTSLSDTQQSRASLKSIASINTDASGDDVLVHCRYTKCTSATTQIDARKYYKSCHNCSYLYCSRECRRAHWERHRKICLHSRASSLCRQILSTAKEDADSIHHISLIAQKGYLMHGRGVVKVFFTSPNAAEKFTTNGFQSLGEPVFVKWPDLMPNEMGPELYAELIKLCKSYNPETRLVLYVAVCIVSEVPTKGAAVKWERQIVSRCAKLRLSSTVMGNGPNSQISTYNSPKMKMKNKNDKNKIASSDNTETLILTSNSANLYQKNNISMQKIREISFSNIQLQLQKRGVNLKRHYPEVYSKLCSYVEGICDKFTPITIYPRDNLTGKSFMCVIMPETEPDKFQTLPSDSVECRTIDVSIDHSDQVSTPM